MGCQLCKHLLLKHDEVSPISIRPLHVTDHNTPAPYQKTSKPGVITEERAIPQQQRQVTLTNEITPPKPTNQKGPVILTNDIAPSKSTTRNDSVVLTPSTNSTNEKASVVLNGDVTPPNSTNQHDSVTVNDTTAPSSTNEKGSVIVTNAATPLDSTNQNDETIPAAIEDVQCNHEEESAGSVNVEEEDIPGVTKVKEANQVPSEEDGEEIQNDEDHLPGEEINEREIPQPETSSLTIEKAAVNGNITENGDAGENDDSSAPCPGQGSEAAPEDSASPEAENGGFQMPEVVIEKVLDGEGCPITLGMLFGTWTVPWPWLPQQILRAQFFHFDDSDVFLVGYAKSGSHWLWEMVHMLMSGRAQHCRTPKERLMLSFSTQEFFDTLPPPRVFNTHAPFMGFPAAIREGTNKCKMIYLLRNPKDVAVSYYHHLINQVDFEYEGTFHGYLDLFLDGKMPGGSWFDYVLGWEETLQQHPELSVQVLYYEDIKEDTVGALQTLNEFLGLGREQSLLTEIANQCTLGRMKAVDEELKEQGPQHVNLSKTGKNFILRKGEVGDWRNWFTEEDDRRFMEVVHNKLRDSHLRFRYVLEKEEEEEEMEEDEKKKTVEEENEKDIIEM